MTGRYYAFAWSNYYPCGGWNDFVGAFDTEADAWAAAKATRQGNYQVVDSFDLREI